MTLSETWFMEGYIDFELQKYKLLAYLQDVNKCFNQHMLYPQLSDVIFHYNNLVSFRDNKKFLQDSFPRMLNGVDMQKAELVYEQMLQDDEMMQELENITVYALNQMKGTLNNGTELYDTVEKHIQIEPIGIMPLYKSEGYMLLRYNQHKQVRAYYYTVSLFEGKDTRFKGLRMEFVDTWEKSIANTYENIKRDIIRSVRALPNPAVYSVESDMDIPFMETMLPVAKRMLVRHIA